MKKILKGLLCLAVAFVCVVNLTACKKKVSDTTTNTEKTIYNGEATNGGATLVHDGYLYFINGTKTNDGTSATKNTKSAICRVKMDNEGELDSDTYEVVVDNLVGFSNGSMSIFGDYLYFTTPNNDVNYQDTKLNYQTKFMRYDLVNEKLYTIYTTKINSSNEIISFSYYIVGDDLNLLVYETSNSTITSIKIDKKPVVNYVINNVTSCVLSENYGKCEVEGVNVDANNYVFYTKTVDVYEDGRSDGNKTFKTSPVTDNSVCISNEGKTVSLLSIRAGKLVYSTKSMNLNYDIIYAQSITSSTSEKLTFTDIISYSKYQNIIFVANSDYSISVLCFDDDTKSFLWLNRNAQNPFEINPIVINQIEVSSSSSSSSSSSTSAVTFIGISTLKEEIKSDKELEEGEEPETEEVKYLTYIVSNVVYKIEIMRDGVVSTYVDPVKLSKSTISAPSGVLLPESIGNYLYVFAKELGADNKETDNIYLHRVDLTIEENSSSYATIVAIKEA